MHREWRQRWYSLGTQFWSGDLCICLYYSVYTFKMAFFPSLSPLLYTKVALSLTNVVTYPRCFLNAYKRLWRLPVLAGTSDWKFPSRTEFREFRKLKYKISNLGIPVLFSGLRRDGKWLVPGKWHSGTQTSILCHYINYVIQISSSSVMHLYSILHSLLLQKPF